MTTHVGISGQGVRLSSGQLKGAVSLDYFDLGEVAFEQNRIADARATYQQSLALRQQLAAVNSTNADLQQLILRTMIRLASVNDPKIGWERVADQYRAIKAAGHRTPADERVLDALQKRGLGIRALGRRRCSRSVGCLVDHPTVNSDGRREGPGRPHCPVENRGTWAGGPSCQV